MDFGSLVQSGGMLTGALITCVTTLPFLAIALFFAYLWRRNNQQARASQQWASTRGTIGASSVQMRRSHSSEGGTTTSYYPELLYEYNVAGKQYIGQRITFGSQVGYGDAGRAQAIVDRYVLRTEFGSNQIRVYYNPANPSDAVLERSAGTSSTIFFWVAIFILLILCITVVPVVLLLVGMNSLFSNLPFLR
ncbi:MAG: DUF3592 domain-containing protein [Chloroflexi bacterium]|nr:DUF3592 domain-containing protein [Chloroflexota bacterium]